MFSAFGPPKLVQHHAIGFKETKSTTPIESDFFFDDISINNITLVDALIDKDAEIVNQRQRRKFLVL